MRASPVEAQLLVEELSKVWHGMAGRAPGTWEQDVPVLERWWQPWKSKAKLVPLIEALPSVDDMPGLPGEWFLRTGIGVVLTPDGRLALEGLQEATTGRRTYDSAAYFAAHGHLVEALYRSLAQRNLRRIVGNLTGEGEAMYVLSAAALLTIIASGADRAENALTIDSRLDDVNDALERPLVVLRNAFGQRSRNAPPFADYPCTRAADRVGSALALERPSRNVLRTWVDGHRQAEVLRKIALDLTRRGKPFAELETAVIETLDAYERGHAALVASAGASSTREQRVDLRQRLLGELDRAKHCG